MRRATAWIIGGVLLAASATACSKADDVTSTTPQTAAVTTVAPAPSSTGASTTASPGDAPTTASSGGAGTGDKAAFLTAGNAICKQVNDTSAGYSDQYQSGPKTPAALQKLLDANGVLIEDSVAKLKALPQPAGDEAQLAAMYEGVLKLASFSHQMATASGTGDNATVQRLQNEGKVQQKAVNAQFTAYGLTECGKGS